MNYYNENDPKAAAWLRQLITAGLIPLGTVDERSIAEIKPSELNGFTQCHFFAGIAGWPLALQLSGWPFDRPVGTGSCPCQPFSAAGKQLGASDPRHLWPVFFKLITGCRDLGQQWAFTVFGEQVASAIGKGWLDGISADLESEGYACGAVVLGAHSVGSPHIRQRLFWVADANPTGRRAVGSRGDNIDRQNTLRGQGDIQLGTDRETCALADSKSEGRQGVESELQTGLGQRSRPWGDSTNGGLAESDGRNASAERQQRGGQQRQQPQDSGVDRLEHTEGQRREQRGTESGGRSVKRGRRPCTVGVGDPDSARFSEQCGTVSVPAEQLTAELRGNAWDSYDILPCTDGKARRVESGTFPLANGVSGRVGLLRGYGNAIVPQVAAEFVAAWDSLNEWNATTERSR